MQHLEIAEFCSKEQVEISYAVLWFPEFITELVRVVQGESA